MIKQICHTILYKWLGWTADVTLPIPDKCSKVEHWKRGFYYIAQKADVPILLFAVDYQNKRIVCHKEIRPGSDEQKDLKEIMDYYRPFKGRHPEKFQVESI